MRGCSGGPTRIIRAVCARLQLTGLHKHRMGICSGEPFGRVAVWRLCGIRQSSWWATLARRTSQTQHGHLRWRASRMRSCTSGLCRSQQSGGRATSAHRTSPSQPGHFRWRTSRMRCCLGALPESAEQWVSDPSSPDFINTAWAFTLAASRMHAV